MRMRFVSCVEASLGASIHGGIQQAHGLIYLVGRFLLGGGHTW
jgi:hypothetical protein